MGKNALVDISGRYNCLDLRDGSVCSLHYLLDSNWKLPDAGRYFVMPEIMDRSYVFTEYTTRGLQDFKESEEEHILVEISEEVVGYLKSLGVEGTSSIYYDVWYDCEKYDAFQICLDKNDNIKVNILKTRVVQSWLGEILYYEARVHTYGKRYSISPKGRPCCKAVSRELFEQRIQGYKLTGSAVGDPNCIYGLGFSKSGTWYIDSIEDMANSTVVTYREEMSTRPYKFMFVKKTQRFVDCYSPYGREDLPAKILNYLRRRYPMLCVLKSVNFSIYVWDGENVVYDNKHLADSSNSLEDCKEICRNRKECRFIVIEYSRESILHQYDVVRKGKSVTIKRIA